MVERNLEEELEYCAEHLHPGMATKEDIDRFKWVCRQALKRIQAASAKKDEKTNLIDRENTLKRLLAMADQTRLITTESVEYVLESEPSAEPEYTMEEFMYGQNLGSLEDGSL